MPDKKRVRLKMPDKKRVRLKMPDKKRVRLKMPDKKVKLYTKGMKLNEKNLPTGYCGQQEIANLLNKSVQTIINYRRDLGMPFDLWKPVTDGTHANRTIVIFNKNKALEWYEKEVVSSKWYRNRLK